MRKCLPLIMIALLAPLTGGCAVVAVGSAAVDVASMGVKAATTVGGIAVDGASAAARAGSNAMKSDSPEEKKRD